MAVLRSIQLRNFRQHSELNLDFSSQRNIIIGSNGCGKTTIVEAIHCLMLTKSFRTNKDFEIIRFGEKFYKSKGQFDIKNDMQEIVLYYEKHRGKTLLFDGTKLKSMLSHIGKLPVVVASPEESSVVNGSPSARRQFADKMIGQCNSKYLNSLAKYQCGLRKRNRVLKLKNLESDYLATWTELLFDLINTIVHKRGEAMDKIENLINQFYRKMDKTEEIKIDYSPSIGLYQAPWFFTKSQHRDKSTGFTNFGPHVDRIRFIMNGKPIREYASSGERKLFLTILKLAEGRFLAEKTNKTPIYIFDDLFAGLDKKNGEKILELLSEENQTFITSSDKHSIETFSENSAITHLDKTTEVVVAVA